jgi:hypothetical protein
MALVKPECPKCAQNQAAFETGALRLWESRIEIVNLQDALNDARFALHEMEQDLKLAMNEVDRCRRDHAR